MFTTPVVQPIFNLLMLIYALLPGHNFGVAIIVFTIIARFAFYPLLKKQLRHTKSIKELQPELKKIKEETKGNKQLETTMVMELYKEREVKPMAFLGLMVVQVAIFLALFSGLNRVVNNPQEIYNFSYPAIQNMPVIKEIHDDPSKFDNTLFGGVDLGRAAFTRSGGFYFPAFLLALGSAIIMFYQVRQTSPSDPDARKLKHILKDASKGVEADSSEMNAAMARNISTVMPFFIFVISIGFPAALGLYWFVGNLVGYLQQSYLLKKDEFALTHLAKAEVLSKKPLSSPKKETRDTKKPKTLTTKSGVKVTTYTERDQKAASKKRKKR